MPWVLTENFSGYAARGPSRHPVQAGWEGIYLGLQRPPPALQVAVSLSSQLRTVRTNIALHIPRPRNPWATRGPRLNALRLVFLKKEKQSPIHANKTKSVSPALCAQSLLSLGLQLPQKPSHSIFKSSPSGLCLLALSQLL